MPFTVAQIAKILGGKVGGDDSVVLTGFAPAERAQPGDLTFAENEDYFGRADRSEAAAIILDGPFVSSHGKTLIHVANARVAFAKALAVFSPEPVFPAGVHPTAIVAASAGVDPSAHVGPYCVVGEEARIGPRSVLRGGNHIGPRCRLGEEVVLFPNVTLYADTEIGHRVRIHSGSVIGSDGFGYVQEEGKHLKVPQIGNVIIKEDVEIGACVTIDRGALGPTIIGKGTKIDNLVQIGHNVVVGEHSLIISQVGIAGSTKVGNYVILAGQVGVAGHLKIGNRVQVAAKAGVMHNIPDGEKWLGAPAQPDRQSKRQLIAIQKLPELIRRVNELERRLGGKSERPGSASPPAGI